MSDYLAVNLANWNSRVPHHVAGYGLEAFRTDPQHLSDVVRFDLPRLGSIEGLDVVHLQCHIGTDTVSLARLGAHRVTGLDFSPLALEAARQLADDCGASPDIVHFNHGLAPVISAVMEAGMQLDAIEEHDTVPWNPLGDAMELVGGGEHRLRHAPERLAATYTLQATKRVS